MPVFNGKEAKIYYEIIGNGPPILLLAPGGSIAPCEQAVTLLLVFEL